MRSQQPQGLRFWIFFSVLPAKPFTHFSCRHGLTLTDNAPCPAYNPTRVRDIAQMRVIGMDLENLTSPF